MYSHQNHHCFVCLESGHGRGVCKGISCEKCNGRHHFLLREAVTKGPEKNSKKGESDFIGQTVNNSQSNGTNNKENESTS